MSRQQQNRINNDPEIIRLRMEVEDLINSIDTLDDDVYDREADRLESAIDKRVETLLRQEI